MRDEIFQKRPQLGKSGGHNSVENSKNSLLVQADRATAFESSPNVCEIFLTTFQKTLRAGFFVGEMWRRG